MSETKRYSTTETAQLIRAALKTAFPAVKFSVRSKSYSGGSSIDVSWTDGPTQPEVDRVAGQFAGATFDGMVDLKSYHVSTFEGQQVRFGADFVFANRKVSVDLLRRAVVYANRKYGWTISTDVVVENGSYPYLASTPETNARPFKNHYDVRDLVNQIAHSMRQDGIIVTRMNYPQPVVEPPTDGPDDPSEHRSVCCSHSTCTVYTTDPSGRCAGHPMQEPSTARVLAFAPSTETVQ